MHLWEGDVFEALKELILGYFGLDPTRHWPARKAARLEFDLEARALNGIAFGDRFDRLEVFGKPDNARPVYFNIFKYIEHGITVEIDDELVDYFSFIFADEMDDEFRSPTIRFRLTPSKTVELSRKTTKSDVLTVFGTPLIDETDEYEILLVYETADLKLEFELTPSEALKRLNVFPANAIH